MSTKNLAQKLLRIVFLIVFLGFLVNFLRQVTIYFRANRRLAQKQKELKALEEKNRALRFKLEEVQNPRFFEEQARKLLGVGDSRATIALLPTGLPKTQGNIFEEESVAFSNFQQWWQLFVY
jgi:cell division protein FtsB